VALIAALGLLLPTTTQARDDHGGFRGGSFHGGGRYFHGRFYPYGFGYPFLYPGFGYYGGGYYGSYYGPYGPSYGYDGRPYGYNAGAPGDLAVDVQRSLKRRGYYGGPVDGEIGAGSRNAIRNFQADHHLETTGRMDHDTLRALGI
jgi:hypothetical protein